jgi:hypothetical protein
MASQIGNEVEKSFISLRAHFSKRVSVYSDNENEEDENLFLTENPLL